ncbi:YnbE family lipoprotein [Sulfuriroseicoccus oceanibius]|uniref:Uncharacterized protein n=1 Tax=Sulfuriroseicoccus oceanibius TaxID=2707525 RepID=A0A6B3LDQ6_9BACT|nr:YnbE family lipoprotein [Sulfuriroseicoccus oceanibius]QQL45687.1 hypothetical protein G3M56_003605 [Sulfuriroseicoccus oceanibius]
MKPTHLVQWIAALVLLPGAVSCASVKVEPIEVKPIEINVNVRMTVERELDDFFSDLDEQEAEIVN